MLAIVRRRAGILLSVALVCSACSHDPDRTGGSAGIENFGQLDAHLYRGAQPEGDSYRALAALGVRTVINLTKSVSRRERDEVQKAGMRMFHIPLSAEAAPDATAVREFLRVVTDRQNQPVFVHCDQGRHRTGAMVAAYRIAVDHWDTDQALAEMERYHFGSDRDHPALKHFVESFSGSFSVR